jgi:hypothetical protein
MFINMSVGKSALIFIYTEDRVSTLLRNVCDHLRYYHIS